MAKISNGAAQISNGPVLPTGTEIAPGTLFFKTDSTGGPQGLYVYSYIRDSDKTTLGYQVSKDWVAVGSDLAVLRTGDVMTGTLALQTYLRVTQASGASRLLIGNQDAGGANKPSILEGQNGVISIGYGNSWLTSGGALVSALVINAAISAGLTFRGNQVWHAGNHGIGSGLNADLLANQNAAFYLNTSNMATGVLALARGGTGLNSTVGGGIPYGVGVDTLAFSSPGISGQILQSGGTGAPVWVNQFGVGKIDYFPAANAPGGYIKANGTMLSRTGFANLWAFAQASGNISASEAAWQPGGFSPGDGSTTFRIPDVRGVHIRSADDGRGLDGGRQVGTYQADQQLAHTHGVSDPTHAHGVSDPSHAHGVYDPGHAHTDNRFLPSFGADPYAGSAQQAGYNSFDGSTSAAVTSVGIYGNYTGIGIYGNSTGITVQTSSGGAETRVKNIALLACIKY